jgi:plastocyanin domain-containing protein
MDKFIVVIAGILLSIFIFRFFLMKRTKAVKANGEINIIVKGGYTPEVISVPAGQKTILKFTRQDDNSCLEEVVLGDFGARKTLPLNEVVAIEIAPEKPGEYVYTCGMGMFHGKIIAE